MQKPNDVLRLQQQNLFPRVSSVPRWLDLAPDIREETTRLLARLLREQRERNRTTAGEEQTDE